MVCHKSKIQNGLKVCVIFTSALCFWFGVGFYSFFTTPEHFQVINFLQLSYYFLLKDFLVSFYINMLYVRKRAKVKNYEQCHENTCFLHMQKQRRRSAVR